MKHKTILFALAAVSAAMFALPAGASAGGWHIDPAGVAFTVAGGHTILTAPPNENVTCTSVSGTGSYDAGSKTTGTIQLTFHGCKASFFACTSAGQSSGTIKTTALTFHNIYYGPNKTTPGVLITPNAGHFATFTCAGFLTAVVGGNGIIGEVTSPKCGATSKTSTLNFEATGGTQKRMQITETGTKYDLSASLNGGAAATAGQDGTGTITFAKEATMTCI